MRLKSVGLLQVERSRIYAVTKPGGLWAILEDMTQMGITGRAPNFHSEHTVATVFDLLDRFWRDQVEETGPACT